MRHGGSVGGWGHTTLLAPLTSTHIHANVGEQKHKLM